ncbi:MAG: flavodoxin family protein [Firmicutes bacterium]|nr:flavodoxin family protein [Bacillota bacterium]
MNILIFNGSPRNGNTAEAIRTLREGLAEYPGLEITEIKAADMHMIPCQGCGACMCNSECVFGDDSKEINRMVEAADFVLFATPVYWWGVSSQLKLVINKFYSCYERFQKCEGKRVGTIVIGEARLSDPQYEIIEKQFWCICDFLKWNKVFSKSYSADKPTDLSQNSAALEEIRALAKVIAEG